MRQICRVAAGSAWRLIRFAYVLSLLIRAAAEASVEVDKIRESLAQCTGGEKEELLYVVNVLDDALDEVLDVLGPD